MGKEIIAVVQVLNLVALAEYPSADFGNVDGTPRTSVVTDPPSDLQLDWDTSLISADSVEIVLMVVVPETDQLQDVGVLATLSNSGSALIPADTLGEFDLGDSSVMFKVRASRAAYLRDRSRWRCFNPATKCTVYSCFARKTTDARSLRFPNIRARIVAELQLHDA